MKKLLKMLLLVFFLSIIYMYTLVIEKIPNQLVLFEGENISMRTLLGITIKSEDMETIETYAKSSSTSSNSVSSELRKINLRS